MEYTLSAPIIFEKIKQLDAFSLPVEDLSPDDKVDIDLSPVKFLKPPALIGLLVLIERIALVSDSAGFRIRLTIHPPENKYVLDYLYKVRFPEALELSASWHIPDHLVMTSRLRPVIPITRFRTAEDVEQIAIDMQSTFRTELMGLATLLQPCHVIFSELADNILHHANSGGGFVLAQQYNYTRQPMLEIAIGDCGIGITQSLRQNTQYSSQINSDEDALLLALQDGVTRFDDRYRGFGLGHVENEIRNIEDRSLTMRSGTGYVIIHGGGYTFHDSCKFYPGTLAHVAIPCD